MIIAFFYLQVRNRAILCNYPTLIKKNQFPHPSLLLHNTPTPKTTPNTATHPSKLALVGTGVTTGTSDAFTEILLASCTTISLCHGSYLSFVIRIV